MSTLNRLIVFFLVLALSNCTDHRLPSPLASLRLRLKQVVGTGLDGSPINTTYNYDSLNRLSSIKRIDGKFTLISYNNPEKLLIFYIEYADSTHRFGGTVTLFPYDLGLGPGSPPVVVANQYLFSVLDPNSTLANLSLTTHFLDFSYFLDAEKHLIRYSERVPRYNEIERSDYQYTNESITSVAQSSFGFYSGSLQSQTSSVLEYDDKLNPYFGLFDITIDPILRFSANNVTKNTLTSNAVTSTLYTSRYEYNQQGLPIKSISEKDGKTYIITYAYEAY